MENFIILLLLSVSKADISEKLREKGRPVGSLDYGLGREHTPLEHSGAESRQFNQGICSACSQAFQKAICGGAASGHTPVDCSGGSCFDTKEKDAAPASNYPAFTPLKNSDACDQPYPGFPCKKPEVNAPSAKVLGYLPPKLSVEATNQDKTVHNRFFISPNPQGTVKRPEIKPQASAYIPPNEEKPDPALVPSAAENPSFSVKPNKAHDDEDNLERLCNDPFHSFLCQPTKMRQRITGKLRPLAVIPPHALVGDSSFNINVLSEPKPTVSTERPKPTAQKSTPYFTKSQPEESARRFSTTPNPYKSPAFYNHKPNSHPPFGSHAHVTTTKNPVIGRFTPTTPSVPRVPESNQFTFSSSTFAVDRNLNAGSPSSSNNVFTRERPTSHTRTECAHGKLDPDQSGSLPASVTQGRKFGCLHGTQCSSSRLGENVRAELSASDTKEIASTTYDATGYHYPTPDKQIRPKLTSESSNSQLTLETNSGYSYPKPDGERFPLPSQIFSNTRPQPTKDQSNPIDALSTVIQNTFATGQATNKETSGYNYPKPQQGREFFLPQQTENVGRKGDYSKPQKPLQTSETNPPGTILGLNSEPKSGYNYPKPKGDPFPLPSQTFSTSRPLPPKNTNPFDALSTTFQNTFVAGQTSNKETSGYQYQKPQREFITQRQKEDVQSNGGYSRPKPNQTGKRPLITSESSDSPGTIIGSSGYNYPKPRGEQFSLPTQAFSTARPLPAKNPIDALSSTIQNTFASGQATNTETSGYHYPKPQEGREFLLPGQKGVDTGRSGSSAPTKNAEFEILKP